MHGYAQTIPQLYGQLQHDGYSIADMCCIRDAYELAMVLFSGRFLHSGKVFTAHIVGTASILASLRLPVEVVAAGLLHNVYRSGDFGDGRRSIANARREQVQRVVGTEVEQYVARFATLPWNSRAISALRDRPHELEPLDRSVVLLRLADQLEHLLDLDTLYGDDTGRRLYVETGPIAVDTAERLGFAILAATLRQTLEESQRSAIPVELRSTRKQVFGFVLAPQSHHKQLSVTFRRLFLHGLNQLRSSVRSRKLIGVRAPRRVEKNKD